MKKSNYSFADGFLVNNAVEAKKNGEKMKSFDWNKAAEIIKEKVKLHPDLNAEAGLQNDWAYTGGVIFQNGKPTNDDYTFLSSIWAIPSLILSWDDEEQEEIPCFEQEGKYNSESKWNDESISILGINM